MGPGYAPAALRSRMPRCGRVAWGDPADAAPRRVSRTDVGPACSTQVGLATDPRPGGCGGCGCDDWAV
eukprot:gene9158-biopygen4576